MGYNARKDAVLVTLGAARDGAGGRGATGCRAGRRRRRARRLPRRGRVNAAMPTIAVGRERLLPGAAAGRAVGQHARRDDALRARHRARARLGRRRGARLHLYRRHQRRRDPRPRRALPRAAPRRRRRRPHRAALAEDVVGAALRRPRRIRWCWRSRRSTSRCGISPRSARPAAVADARRLRSAGAVLRRRHRPPVPDRPAAAAGRRLPRAGLSRDQDEGRPRQALRGRRARARDAQAPRRGLPADGRREHALVGRTRRSAPPGSCASSSWSGSRSRRSRTTSPAMRASCARAACRSRPARTCARSGSSSR